MDLELKKYFELIEKGMGEEAAKVLQMGSEEFGFMIRNTPNLDKRMKAETIGGDGPLLFISKPKLSKKAKSFLKEEDFINRGFENGI